MSLSSWLEQWEILLVALILGAAHIVAPRVKGLVKYPERQQAFGGGLSVAYLFLHLIPSLDASDAFLGPRIYFVALLGFVAFYGFEVMFQAPKHAHPTKYHAYLAVFFLYDGLLIFTLGLHLPPTPILTLLFALSLALDVLDTDLEMQEDFGERFIKWGRWVLLGAVVIGYGLNLVRRPNRIVIDLLTAGLAGFMMFHTANGVFPVSRNNKFWAFLAGIIAFALLHVLLGAVD